MRLSSLPVSLYPELAAGRMTPGDWMRTAARLGLDGADLSVAHFQSREPRYLDRLRGEADAAGVELPILVTYSDFTHPEASYRGAQTDDLRRWIEAAARMRIPFLRVTAGQAHAGVSEADGLSWAAEGLVACLGEATAAGVGLLYENHTRGSTWSFNDFTQPAARFLEVVRRTEGSRLAILFDTANPLALGDDPVHLLEQIVHRVGAVHLSDIRQRGAFEPTTIGTGSSPLKALLRVLVAKGFDGWISIEEASRTGEEGFRRAIAFADAAWVEAGGVARRG